MSGHYRRSRSGLMVALRSNCTIGVEQSARGSGSESGSSTGWGGSRGAARLSDSGVVFGSWCPSEHRHD